MSDYQAQAIDFGIPEWADDQVEEDLEKVVGLACHLAGALAQDWSDPEEALERLLNMVDEILKVARELGGPTWRYKK